jgi:hypothetical protein
MNRRTLNKKFLIYAAPISGLIFSILYAVKSTQTVGIEYFNSIMLSFILGCIGAVYTFFGAWFYTDFRFKIGAIRFLTTLFIGVISLIVVVTVTTSNTTGITKLFTATVLLSVYLSVILFMNSSANKKQNIKG